MRNALVLAAVIAAAAFGQVYSLGSSAAPELKAGNPPVDLDTLIWYDQLDTSHWWVGMYDSFAIAVRFTPDRYPCQVMGARAEVNRGGYAATYYLRVYAPDGTGGRPGTILQSTPRTDLPLNRTPGFQDYDLSTPVTITSGDFFLCFMKSTIGDLYFTDDLVLNNGPRQWWLLGDGRGWVPVGSYNGRDMHLRARVRYVDPADVGVTRILAPSGTVDSGALITPACSVYNYGSTAQDYRVRLRIGAGYDDTARITGHAPGTAARVEFPAWTALSRGSHALTCSTELAGDAVPANDRQTGSVDVRVIDVAAGPVLEPLDTLTTGAPVTPRVRVRNLGTATATFDLRFAISGAGGPVYDTTETGILLAAGDSADHSFALGWTAQPAGDYAVTANTILAGDLVPANDTTTGAFSVMDTALPPGWLEVAQVPLSPSGRAVKEGGSIAWDVSRGEFFVLKGYKTADFFAWSPVSGAWATLPGMPLGTENKGPYKGATICADGNGTVYATKGNNTPGFWKYSTADTSWSQLADVPLGLSNKKVKGGTDLAYVPGDTDYVYLLKGYKTEFYRFDVAAGTWQTLADAPAGARPKWDKGSWLAHDEPGARLYAHKAKYLEMYAYDLANGTWGPLLPGMPLLCTQTGKSRKAKDGSCAAFGPGGQSFYALKGANSPDFYAYDVAAGAWAERETMPTFGSTMRKKRVKGGGDIATDGRALYALKGNKTLEVWRYVPTSSQLTANSSRQEREGVQSEGRSQSAECRLQIERNPSRGIAVIRWSAPSTLAPCPSTLSIFDASGRLILTRALDHSTAGALSLPALSPGVYVVRVTGGTNLTRKLVIE